MIRFKTFRYSLGILIISAVLCGFWQSATAQVVEIPDPNLERAIREELELSSEVPITQQEMLRLTGFADTEIEDLTGLEYAHNLESLHIPCNPIQDLSPIANLTQLRFLNLAGISIQDLTFLSNLTQLQKITLVSCQIRDITPLANLTQLILLNIRDNWIVDISPIANLTRLEKLWIDNNQIVDVSPLANLTRLTDLTLASNAITDFRPLFGLNLQSVDVDIHKLQELASSEIEIPDPNLERAIREELGLPSHLPVTQQVMLQLYELRAEDAQIKNLTGIEYAQNLEGLQMRNNPVSDLTLIAGLSRLESLELSGIPIEDLTFLKGLTQLRGLYLFACKVTDITPIQNLTKLVVLNLDANRITDLSPLSNLTVLETLWLQANHIVDISPLANLTQLTDLNLEDNRIENVGPLADLTRLERLAINGNRILDFSPIQGLSLIDLRYDEVCVLPGLPIQDRIENRDFPSIFQPWDNGIGDVWDDLPAVSHLSHNDRIAYHDIYWHGPPAFRLYFQKTPPWSQLGGPIEFAVAERNKLLAKNPNMLFLAHLVSTYTAPGGQLPEDWFGWVRDEAGNPVNARPTTYLIDYRRPEVQDVLVQQAVSVAKCGIFDGILYDSWGDGTHLKLRNRSLPYPDYDEQTHAKLLQEEVEACTTILKRIRENVPDDFLILVNNYRKSPFSIPYINGGWMETVYDGGWEDCLPDCGYTRSRIAEIEANLIWYEKNAREPQITCLRGLGIPTEPPNSPNNRRWMRLFTTMSLTLSDGYVLYTVGGHAQHHIWYPFWDADLGQPIGPTVQRYQDIEGLYIREFTNGWAVYNRSGQAQTVILPSSATSVSDRGNNAAFITHLVPDLDGEIYLKTPSLADVNGDGVVNILDLVQVSNSFGKSSPDLNGDGVVNILDLVFVSRYFSAEE